MIKYPFTSILAGLAIGLTIITTADVAIKIRHHMHEPIPVVTNSPYVTPSTTVLVTNVPEPTDPPVNGTIKLMQDSMVAGAMIGYGCAVRGGTYADMATLLKAMHENKPEVINTWIEQHPYKP